MPEKIKLVRLSLKIAGVLFFAAALFFLFVLVGGNILAGFARNFLGNRLLGGAGLLFLAASGAAGVLCLRTAAGVAHREERARTIGLGVGFLLIPLVPFGPVLAVFILSGLLGGEGRSWFLRGGPLRAGKLREKGFPGQPEGRLSDDEPGS